MSLKYLMSNRVVSSGVIRINVLLKDLSGLVGLRKETSGLLAFIAAQVSSSSSR